VDQPQIPPVGQLLAIAALLGAAVVIAALFVAVGHSVALQGSGQLREAELAIQRGQWALVAGSIAAFLVFLALLPVRTRGDWRSHESTLRLLCRCLRRCSGFR